MKEREKMKKTEIKPVYYDGFRCIAGDCPITCCQEWKIAVDEATERRWQANLREKLTQKDGETVIGLTDEMKCPFLNEDKLCKLVIQYGEESLSETCTLFPRQIHDFGDRVEYSLVACCPEVVNILREQKDFKFTESLEGLKGQGSLFELRNLIFSVLTNASYRIEHAMKICFYILLDAYEQGEKINLEPYGAQAIAELAEAIAQMERNPQETYAESCELFLDISENYRKEGIYKNFLEQTAGLAEQYLTEDASAEKIAEFEQDFVKWEAWMRNYLMAEIFADFLLPDSDLEDMVVAFQWIGMEYAVVRQVIFLQYLEDKKSALAPENIRNVIVYIARMTGYDSDDIREYLENSFETLIWEWGYFALITG